MPGGLEQFPTAHQFASDSAPSSADFLYPRRRFRKLREVPYDSYGIPLPLIPSENFDKIPEGSPRKTKHHEHYLYGSQNFISPGGEALRSARILLAEAEVHNGPRGLHYYWDMSPGPRSEHERAKSLLLTAAGEIPEMGIDLWSGQPEIRVMEAGERAILTTISPKNPNYYRNLITNRSGMRKFFEKIILKQPLHVADTNEIQTMAASRKLSRVHDIGQSILADLVNSTVSDIESSYQKAREKGLLHPAAPDTAGEVLLEVLGDEERRAAVFHPQLKRKAKLHVQLVDGTSADSLEEDRIAA